MNTAPPVRPALVPAAWLFAASLLCYGITAGGSLTSTDAVMIFDLTRSMVEDGSIALSPELNPPDRGIDGRFYSQWGIGHSLYGIPFFVAGRVVESFAGNARLPAYSLAKAAFALSSTLVAALTVALCFLLAWVMSGDARGAATAALALGFATPLWPYAGFGFNAPLSSATLVGATLFAWLGIRDDNRGCLIAAGAALGGAWAVRHEGVLAALPIAAWALYEARGDWRRAARWLVWLTPGVLLSAGLLGYYNYIRFGSVVDAGHRPIFALLEGIWGFLFSPGGSIFVFAPILLLGIWGLRLMAAADEGAVILLVGMFGIFFLFYGTMDNWAGGRSYGPRFLVPVLPFLCVPIAAVERQWRATDKHRWLIGLLVASVLIQLPGVLVDYSKVADAYRADGGQLGAGARMNSVTANALALNINAARRLVPANAGYLIGLADPPPMDAAAFDAPLSARLSSSLDTWWMYAYHLGLIGRGPALLILAAMLAMAAACFRQFRLRLHSTCLTPPQNATDI